MILIVKIISSKHKYYSLYANIVNHKEDMDVNEENYPNSDNYDCYAYDPPDAVHESSDARNESDIENYFNNLYRHRSRSFMYDYNPDDFIFDPNTETEPLEGIQEDSIKNVEQNFIRKKFRFFELDFLSHIFKEDQAIQSIDLWRKRGGG